MFEKHIFEKKVSNQKELDDEVEKFILNGYKLVDKQPNSALLRERSYGVGSIHFVLYAFFLLFITLISVDSESYMAGIQYLVGIVSYMPFAAIINVAYILYSMYFTNEFRIEVNNKKVSSTKTLNKKRYCKNCGSELSDDEDFCTECGTSSR